MALDAIFLRAVVQELQELVGLRIDKVQQPTRDQIILLLRGNRRLLLSANPNQPRLQLTQTLRENPGEPPMLCMLLRKHLVGGRIRAIEQPGLERVVRLTVENTNELGESGMRTLVLEAMGRRANLLLLDGEGIILECMRRLDLDAGGARQLLPGLLYRAPVLPEKLSLPELADEALSAAVRGGEEGALVEKWLTGTFLGVSPLIARELALEAFGESDARFASPDEAGRVRLAQGLCALRDDLAAGRFAPYLLRRESREFDFTYRPVAQYGTQVTCERSESFSALLDGFYSAREQAELSVRRGRELTRVVTTARERIVRKLALLQKEYDATQERDALRLSGELITANLYRMTRGEHVLHAQNYYDPALSELAIPLDPLLTPQQNAAKYYKRYNKAKTAEAHLREQMEKAAREQEYLESVLQELSRAGAEQEFADIRRELQETGYLRASRDKKERLRATAPREYRSSAGLKILVGRNNTQNDRLTKSAHPRDIWLHTQKIHGSHVLLCTEGAEPDEQSLYEAAMLAAWWSQAQGGANVPVDYTPAKFVKKPAAARPGMVVYTTYRTMTVTPREDALPQERRK